MRSAAGALAPWVLSAALSACATGSPADRAADDYTSDLAVLECVARYGGSISAEHGVGRAKAAELHLTRSAAEMAAMRAIKRAWDPDGLMNPGVIFEDVR